MLIALLSNLIFEQKNILCFIIVLLLRRKLEKNYKSKSIVNNIFHLHVLTEDLSLTIKLLSSCQNVLYPHVEKTSSLMDKVWFLENLRRKI